MKKKEFKEHPWKEGDIIYMVAFKHYECFDIPVKVVRLRVERIVEKTGYFYAEACNKKDKSLLRTDGFWYLISSRTICSDIFFTKQEAVEMLNRKYDEFKTLHAKTLYKELVKKLNRLDDEKRAVWGIMRMKILSDHKED